MLSNRCGPFGSLPISRALWFTGFGLWVLQAFVSSPDPQTKTWEPKAKLLLKGVKRQALVKAYFKRFSVMIIGKSEGNSLKMYGHSWAMSTEEPQTTTNKAIDSTDNRATNSPKIILIRIPRYYAANLSR